jgi:hypothetical protein
MRGYTPNTDSTIPIADVTHRDLIDVFRKIELPDFLEALRYNEAWMQP